MTINKDIPISNELDWLDLIHEKFDSLNPKEIVKINSISELLIILTLSGFSFEDQVLTEGDVWYGLITWFHYCHILKPEEYDMPINIAIDYHAKKFTYLELIYRCILEFNDIDESFKDKIFAFFVRMKNSNTDIDNLFESMQKALLKRIVPKDDIPES